MKGSLIAFIFVQINLNLSKTKKILQQATSLLYNAFHN